MAPGQEGWGQSHHPTPWQVPITDPSVCFMLSPGNVLHLRGVSGELCEQDPLPTELSHLLKQFGGDCLSLSRLLALSPWQWQ